MTYIETVNDPVRKIQSGDDDFMIPGKIGFYPRAYIEISNECPSNWVNMINTAISNGWITPVAYVSDAEIMWKRLGE